MSHVLVTGGAGFIGQALVRRLLDQGLGGQAVRRLSMVDLGFEASAPADPRLRRITGGLQDPAVRAEALREPPDVLFHLASLPGGAAERDPVLGRLVNLDATLALIEHCRSLARPPRFIYASSIAVYGEALPEAMDEDCPTAPALSYGTHKRVCELLLADACRRGWVEGGSLRLPGVVARPGEGAGLMSAFMNQLFWRLAAGQSITLPVSADARCWWMSVSACVDNLLHAVSLDASAWGPQRCHQMPVLQQRVDAVIEALSRQLQRPLDALVRYAPEPQIQRLFGSYPALRTPRAEAAGLRHDGDLARLVRRALNPD